MSERYNLIKPERAFNGYAGSNPYETNYSNRPDPFDDRQAYEMNEISQSSTAEEHLKQFLAAIDDLTSDVKAYESDVGTISQMQQRLLNLIDPAEAEEMRRVVEGLRARSSATARELKNRIRQVESEVGRDQEKILHIQSVKNLMKLALQAYYDSEVRMNQYLSAEVARQYKVIQPEATDEDIQHAIDNGMAGQVFANAILQGQRVGQAKMALEDAQQRQQDISKISSTVLEIAELMQDLMAAVEAQGEQIEEVEQLQSKANHHVEEGLDHLRSAVKHAWLRKRWKRILAAVIVIILIIILAPIIVRFSH
ncbi:t-SNARE [Lipomyces arxii]|uniref:t-SNARE n=1 Tax=Lipomyces arxii TaxID=56418 RepID=UPI0034CD0B55